MGKEKKQKNLAVFDLDGTLWRENSHLVLVNQYFSSSKASLIFYKIYGRIFPGKNMERLNNKFDQIPNSFIEKFIPHINEQVLEIFDNYKKSEWNVVIITNAPLRIAKYAEKYFDVKVYHADIGNKKQVLMQFSYDRLEVISDNISDINIMELANHVTIPINKKNRKYFEKNKTKTMDFLYCRKE